MSHSLTRNLRNELVAETRILLPSLGLNRELRITTQKTISGVVCRASVVTSTENGFAFAFDDFSRTLERDPKIRAVETNIVTMHMRHTADPLALIAEAVAHYAI